MKPYPHTYAVSAVIIDASVQDTLATGVYRWGQPLWCAWRISIRHAWSLVVLDLHGGVALPAAFPCREIHHDPENTQCSCGCCLERIGEYVREKPAVIVAYSVRERGIHNSLWAFFARPRIVRA